VLAGIIKPTTGTVQVGGRIGSLLELGAGFHPDFSGRENVYLNGSIQGLRRAEIRDRFDEIVAFAEIEHAIDRPVRTYSSGMAMRLGFAIAAFLQADVLLLDEVFAVGDENFQRKCFGVIAAFKNEGGTILFVSHDAQAVERLCERSVLLAAGEKAYDGPTHEAIVRYRRLLADDVDPAELGAGLREWGTGEAQILGARLLDGDGGERQQLLAGEPFRFEVDLETHEHVEPPRLHVEVRDNTGILVSEQALETAAVGWPDGSGTVTVRLDVDRSPLQFGRFRVRLGLVAADGRTLHHYDNALTFLVYPNGEERGLVHLGGTWHTDAKGEIR
jgi:ABC-type polysaccharide/polyol phosphate transport system ATPase subunit